MPQFLVIEFTEDNVKDIISSEWLIGRYSCRFPKQRAEYFMKKHIRHDSEAGSSTDWEIHPIRVISSKGNKHDDGNVNIKNSSNKKCRSFLCGIHGQ